MKPKEILIILVLAVLVTGGSWFCSRGERCVLERFPGSWGLCLESRGWPSVFWQGSISLSNCFSLIKGLQLRGLLLDFLFWFLVLAAGWWMANKLKMKKSKLKIWLVSLVIIGATLASGWWVWNNYQEISCYKVNKEFYAKLKNLNRSCQSNEDCEAVDLGQGICINKNEDISGIKKLLNHKCLQPGEGAILYYPLSIQPLYGCECKNNICKEIQEKQVTITTDKTEYEQGEKVKVVISNDDKSIYVSYQFGTGVSFHQLKENLWTKLTTRCPTNCIEFCENNTLKQKPCPMKVPPQYLYYEYKGPWETQWNQNACIYETKLCGGKTYSRGLLKQVSAGKFKVKFCYFDQEDVDLSKRPGYASPDKKKCIENEFRIEEKKEESKEISCNEKCMSLGYSLGTCRPMGPEPELGCKPSEANIGETSDCCFKPPKREGVMGLRVSCCCKKKE